MNRSEAPKYRLNLNNPRLYDWNSEFSIEALKVDLESEKISDDKLDKNANSNNNNNNNSNNNDNIDTSSIKIDQFGSNNGMSMLINEESLFNSKIDSITNEILESAKDAEKKEASASLVAQENLIDIFPTPKSQVESIKLVETKSIAAKSDEDAIKPQSSNHMITLEEADFRKNITVDVTPCKSSSLALNENCLNFAGVKCSTPKIDPLKQATNEPNKNAKIDLDVIKTQASNNKRINELMLENVDLSKNITVDTAPCTSGSIALNENFFSFVGVNCSTPKLNTLKQLAVDLKQNKSLMNSRSNLESVAVTTSHLKKSTFVSGTTYKCWISNVESPTLFWIQLKENSKAIAKLSKSLE